MRTTLPASGQAHDEILDQLNGFREHDADWRGGRTWSLVYYAGDDHYTLLKKAHHLFFSENGLNPMAFKSLKRMEGEVVQMTASMLNGGPETVGTMTSGGTESILLSVKAYRDRARALRPWIRRPEMVVPRTIHVAFDKAAHYFGVKMRYAPIGDDFRVDVRAMKKLINRNTIALAASAPQYPHGVVDPIAEIGALALKRRLPFHVDACFGGFVLPWIEKLGYDVPLFDFRVPGVTSMSADVHKYGYAAKGASVVVYRDMSYLKHQFFVSTDWPGGIYASPSMPGTRPGGPIAAAWAALRAMGEEGYKAQAGAAMKVAANLRAGVEQIPGLRILGKAHAPVVTWGSDDEAIDVYAVADLLAEKGWGMDRQQMPPSVHCTVNGHNAPIVGSYLADLAAAVEHVRAHPELCSEGDAAIYGLMAKVPVRGIVKHSVRKVMEAMYGPDGDMPDLSRLGEREEDGLLLGALHKYGDRVSDALGHVASAKQAISSFVGRQ